MKCKHNVPCCSAYKDSFDFRGKPYVIVFVGVNGVGKSTNLAKIAYWLVQNKMTVGSAVYLNFISSSCQVTAFAARVLLHELCTAHSISYRCMVC